MEQRTVSETVPSASLGTVFPSMDAASITSAPATASAVSPRAVAASASAATKSGANRNATSHRRHVVPSCSCSCSSGGSCSSGSESRRLSVPRARAKSTSAPASVRPSLSAPASRNQKTNCDALSRNASTSSTSTRVSQPDAPPRSCFASRQTGLATRPARRMNTRRSVWLRNSSGGTSAGAPEPGTPSASAFFLRSRRRVSSTAAVVANRANETPETATPTRSATSRPMASQSHESASSSNTPRSPSAKTTRPGASLPSGAAYRRKAARATKPSRDVDGMASSSSDGIIITGSERCLRLAPRTASSPPSRRPARVNARFSHANVACASGRMRSPALERVEVRRGRVGTRAFVSASRMPNTRPFGRSSRAGERSKRGAAKETRTFCPRASFRVSCGTSRTRRGASAPTAPCSGDAIGHAVVVSQIGTQLFSSRAHGAMSSLHF